MQGVGAVIFSPVSEAMEMNVCQHFSLEQLREMQESRRDQIASQAKFE